MATEQTEPTELESLRPGEKQQRMLRKRLHLKGEFMLALLPTLLILGVLALVEALSHQRLLFASLASSAFLIYLDPEHGMNRVGTLVLSQMMAATLGLLIFMWIGPGYLAGGVAMVLTIALMIVLDKLHPPAVATALSFGLRAGSESNLVLFGMAVAITAALVVLQRAAVWMLTRYTAR